MHPDLKKTLKSLSLDLRHLLEGQYDAAGVWRAGDLEQRLNALGVWRDRAPLPADELSHLSDADHQARAVVDAYMGLRRAADIDQAEAVAEFVRETAYTWANRLLALRCMEARGLIDEVILQKGVYGGRSLEHHRLAQRQPERCMGEDDGLFAVLEQAFDRQAAHLPLLFDPRAPGVALRPSVAALKQAVTLLSAAPVEIFQAPDALGWAYQYWNTEEKDRVFEKVRTERGAKIAGADIIPATQLYTEPYMVKFLVQNSLGALWMGMYPDSKLYESWEYYVRDADRAPVTKKSLCEVTFLDPACGSGHFLLEAFDLFYAMYKEEGDLTTPETICAAILAHNLYGIDIDERAVQIAEAALWMQAAEKIMETDGPAAFQNLKSKIQNLVATNIRLPRGKDHLAAFRAQHPEDRDLRPALEVIFEGLEHADELGSLLQLEEPVEKELRYLQAKMEERTGRPEQLALLAQVEKPKQGELPIGVESYVEWKTRTLARLKTHFAVEAQAADLRQAFFGRSAEKGVRLFDLLARRYDVVAANPPYMGSGNMGVAVKKYMETHYTLGKRDLYAAFILRCLGLAVKAGRVAMVTQQSWMFLRSFVNLRAMEEDKITTGTFSGLLRETWLETLAHLGPGAFGEISGEVVNIVLFTLANNAPIADHRIETFRLIGPKSSEEKDLMLRNAICGHLQGLVFRPTQIRFLVIPQFPICYWLRERFFELLASNVLRDLGDVKQGLATANDARFVRFIWEVYLSSQRWFPYYKGGGYGRWDGFGLYCVDWENNGARVKSRIDPKYSRPYSNVWMLNKTEREMFMRQGLTASLMAQGSFAMRLMDAPGIFSSASPCFFSNDIDYLALAGCLNSRVTSYVLRALSPELKFREGYVAQAPVLNPIPASVRGLAEFAFYCKSQLIGMDLVERRFMPLPEGESDNLQDMAKNALLGACGIAALLHTAEGVLEQIVFEAYCLDADDVSSVLNETGVPAGWLSIIGDYSKFPTEFADLSKFPKGFYDSIQQNRVIDDEEIAIFRANLRLLFESGPGLRADEIEGLVDENDHEQDDLMGAYIPIPTETFLEELSQRVQVHPISVYWLLKEGIQQEDWRCLPEERRITADRFTVLILRLLGHRWPKQIEAGEPVPEWADPGGIIPLTDGIGAPTLLARVRERLAAEFPGGEVAALEREFQELMGESLDAWLGMTFFKHHTRQFKKRPIAWQLQSGRWTARQKPAFACLVYYHQLDGDTLTTLQSQYVRPLRQRCETELRGIEGVPAAARSARQDARRIELGDLIKELSDFDAALGRVAAEGFASPALDKIIAQEPVDRWCSPDGVKAPPEDRAALLRQERRYMPDLNDGVRVNIAPLQKAGLLAADVLAKKDREPAIADRAEWRADERRWVREGKLPRPGWWEK